MEVAASTETRALTSRGSTESMYASSCSMNQSMDGTDTTRVAVPSDSSTFAASTAYWTSEPEAIRMRSGVSADASTRT